MVDPELDRELGTALADLSRSLDRLQALDLAFDDYNSATAGLNHDTLRAALGPIPSGRVDVDPELL